jgi:hypothetical protein
MSDASSETQKRSNGRKVAAGTDYACEVVTPILQYEDMEDLQNIIRALVAKGAFANKSCGIHVHVDGARHTPESLTRLLNFAVGRQDLFYEALQIGARSDRWCHKMSRTLLVAMKNDETKTKASAERIWYSRSNDGYTGGVSHEHYNSTRYHGINLHAFFTKGTVEFRLFNGTTHAGKIKAYVQFCLAVSALAINSRSIKMERTDSDNEKYTFRCWLLRLGLIGDEFKTCRTHMMANLHGCSAWRNGHAA